MNRKDWRTISLSDIDIDAGEIEKELVPLLREDLRQGRRAMSDLAVEMRDACRRALSEVFPFSGSEMSFLNLLLDKGEIEPALLTPDKDLQGKIKIHPMLEWKAQNVRSFKKLN